MRKDLLLSVAGWAILCVGMAVFLFVKETTVYVRIFAVLCCIIGMVFFSIKKGGEKAKK